MDHKRTLGNHVLIRLDKENDSIKLKNGFELFVDLSYEPEKHATILGTVFGLPSHLKYSGKPNLDMPWLCDMELSLGDKVVFYYLSVMNAFKPENRKYILDGDDRYVLIPYDKIYAVYGEGFIKPINGYCLVKQVPDPSVEEQRRRMHIIGLEPIIFQKKSNTHVTFAQVKYMASPIMKYVDENSSDEGVDIEIGDTVVLKKTYDLPLEYELHSRIDKPSKLIRVQRRNILAKL